MIGQQLLFTVLLSCPFLSMGNVGPPVYLFRDARVESTIGKPLAGHTIGMEDFSKLLEGVKDSDLLITFLQDELSNEDFLRSDKKMVRGGLFKNIQRYSKMKTATYFPSVKAPEHSIDVLSQRYNEQVELKDAVKVVDYLTNTKLEKDTAILIHLYPTNAEHSSEAIKQNDELIDEVMSLVEKSGLTYKAFFTGRTHRKAHEAAVVQGVGRHLLEVTLAPKSNNGTTQFFFNDTNCLLFIDTMKMKGELVTATPDISCSVNNGTNSVTMTISLSTPNNDSIHSTVIVMTFTKDVRKMWMLNTTTVDNNALSVPDISGPLYFCYHCSVGRSFYDITNATKTPALYFKTIQVQVFNVKEDMTFGYAYDCVGFFTIPLWTGLLTALLLVMVMIYGFYMLSSIQTFDQYDDPKGKPLTINVSE